MGGGGEKVSPWDATAVQSQNGFAIQNVDKHVHV